MILYRIVEEEWTPPNNDYISRDEWELVKVPRGLYVTPEGALRVMKELQADSQRKDSFFVQVIETDDTEPI